MLVQTVAAVTAAADAAAVAAETVAAEDHPSTIEAPPSVIRYLIFVDLASRRGHILPQGSKRQEKTQMSKYY